MPKPLHEMSRDERVAEITSIMVQAVLRLKCKKLNKNKGKRRIPLDSSGNQSVHAHETLETKEKP